MSRSCAGCPGGRGARQHHRCSDRGSFAGLRSALRSAVALALIGSVSSASAQSLLHIRVLEGEGAIHPAGTKSPRALVVEVTDETGRPVDGAAVSFRLPEEGPGAAFRTGIRSEIAITTPDGRAAVHELITRSAPGPFQIRVTAVKDSVRAGTVVDQYVSDAPVRHAGGATKTLKSQGTGSKKWLLWAAAAGGAAAAGIILGMRGTTVATAAPVGVPTVPPTIGAPEITVGGPQ